MRIEAALAGVEAEGAGPSVEVNGVQYDSRRVRQGDLFVAMRGGSSDGNRYIEKATAAGAAAVVTDSREVYAAAKSNHPGVGFYWVAHGRRALAGIAANVLGDPERMLKISAVTGTNGKTTTAFLLEQMLKSVGRTCVLVGTIETHVGDEVRLSEHTTPEASDLLKVFADGVKVGATEAVMEMSSHALDQERVWGVPVDVAIFTNLTQDHLDYHGTMEAYFAAKARIFEGIGCEPPVFAVINQDDSYGPGMISAARGCGNIWTYAIEGSSAAGGEADFVARKVEDSAGGTAFEAETPQGIARFESPLTGRVNVYNLLAASAAAMAREVTLKEIVAVSKVLRQVPGRFQTVPNDLGFTVVVDYAHTDDALRNLIALARELVGAGRVITVFGCGGDRDRSKRPKMGRVAGLGSDLIVLTSDNPRTEEPRAILAEALVGVRETNAECVVEEDRATAISFAIRTAKSGDIVLIAGKGHEKVQILADRTVAFDDVAVAEAVLRELQG